MTVSIAIVFIVLAVAFILFVTGWLKPDLIAMLVLVSLVFSQVIEPAEAFAGFSSFAVITIAGLMVIGEGLEKTGVVKWVATQLARVIQKRYGRLVFINTAVPGVLSGFLNIIAAASFFIPVILRLCKQMKVPQSKILMPMASAALLGANLTLIGASHNLVVDSLLTEATGTGLAFFEFTLVGVALLVVTVGYVFLVGQRLLPGEAESPDPEDVPVSVGLAETYGLKDRLFEVWVGPPEEGDTAPTLETLDIEGAGLSLLAVVRGSDELIFPEPDMALDENDLLLMVGREDLVEDFADRYPALAFLGPAESQKAHPVSTAELAEAVVPPRSPLIGKTIRDLDLGEKYAMAAIAYFREDTPHRSRILDAEIMEGDGLLVYGPREKMRDFNPEKELLIYFKPGEPDVSTSLKRKGPIAAAILVLVILAAALGWMPIAATALAGAVAMVLTGIIPMPQVYRVIDWKTLILIGGMYPLGVALTETGAADLIGETLIALLGGFGPLAVLAGVSILAMILTQPMHNAAVAIIVTPIAINAATLMDSNPVAFAIAVIVSCSAAFLMPYGHPASLMVQVPGGYRNKDYLLYGSGLILLVLAVILGLVPLLWPL